MLTGAVTEPLRSLLEFESERHNVPITYNRKNLAFVDTASAFRPEVAFHVHAGHEPCTFVIPVGGKNIRLTSPVYGELPAGATGPVVDGEILPIAYVTGRHVLIPFDLEGMESDSPNAVNILFDLIAEYALPKAVEAVKSYTWKEEKGRYIRIKQNALQHTIRRMKSDIEDNRYEVDRKTREIEELTLKNAELKETLSHFENVLPRRKEENAIREFGELLKLQPKPYRNITFDDSHLTAETLPLEIAHEGRLYALGGFSVEIALETGQVTIRTSDGQDVEGYGHPHIDVSGNPCWGNIGVSMAKILCLKQYPQALILIHQFLNSYNESDAYLRIEKWDPDWEGERDYDECYENSGSLDCVHCGDCDCPHWEGRYDRCMEFTDMERCLGCKECDHYLTEIEVCQDGHSPQDCVVCSESRCPHAGDHEYCFEVNDGEECDSCGVESCPHHPENNEEIPNESTDRAANP